MALTASARKQLYAYISRAQESGQIQKLVISNAIQLTKSQHQDLQKLLTGYWGCDSYICPALLDLQPSHGYKSRVQDDGFEPAQFGAWIETGCSDIAIVSSDRNGRPRLVISGLTDYPKYKYSLAVTVRSDAHQKVFVDSVIPEGLPPGAKK